MYVPAKQSTRRRAPTSGPARRNNPKYPGGSPMRRPDGSFPERCTMTAILLQMAVCGALGGGSDPNVAPSKLPAIQASVAAPSDSACRVLDVALGKSGSITVGFPNRATCGAGLTLISGGAPSCSQMAIIRVRVLNRGSGPIQLPVRALLAPSGVQIGGAGTPSNITAITLDSILAGGVALWRTGGSGLLAPGDSTVVDTVKIAFAAPARHAKLTFGLDAMTADTSRPVIPSITQWPDPPLVVTSEVDTSDKVQRNVFRVMFEDTTSGSSVNQFLERFSGSVIGALGATGSSSQPVYYVLVPDPGPTWRAVDSLGSVMRAYPGVVLAGPAPYGGRIKFRGRFPVDFAPSHFRFRATSRRASPSSARPVRGRPHLPSPRPNAL